MHGYKTVTVSAATLITGILACFDIGLDQDTLDAMGWTINQLVGGSLTGTGALMLAMRFLTKTPIFNGHPKFKKILAILGVGSVLTLMGCSLRITSVHKFGPIVRDGLSAYCLATPHARKQIRSDWSKELTPYSITVHCPGDK